MFWSLRGCDSTNASVAFLGVLCGLRNDKGTVGTELGRPDFVAACKGVAVSAFVYTVRGFEQYGHLLQMGSADYLGGTQK